MRMLIRALLGIVLAVAVLVGAAVAWLSLRDPLAALPVGTQGAALVERQLEYADGRQLHRVVLREPTLGRIALVVSLPEPLAARPLAARRLPVIVLLGGVKTGADAVRLLPSPGANAVVGYEWPVGRDVPDGAAVSPQAYTLYRQVLSVPGQVVAAIDWVAEQPWADGERISLLGVSLGALAVPAIHRLAQETGRPIGWTVIAYGGAPLGALLAADRQLIPAGVRPVAAPLAGLVLRPLEPAEHLPHLTGRFLAIGARDEDRIPEAAAARLRALIPEPKTIALVDGGHIRTSQTQTLVETVRITNAWLVGQGAINPP